MISIVVPVYNEEESLEAFFIVLSEELEKIEYSSEIIFIDDGSTDRSLEILKNISEKEKNIRIFSFRKNQGKAEALTLGFLKANGEFIVTLDADLQDRPSEILILLNKMEEGYDLVCGWRKNRKDSFSKIISSRLFNLIARNLWGLSLHDYNCGLKLYTKEAAKSLYLYGGMHRFIPLIIFQEGFSVGEIEITHDIRKYGKSKYGFSKIWKDLPDIFTMFFIGKYAKRPLHFFGGLGSLFFILGIIILSYLSVIHFQGETIGSRPLLFLGMLLILSGFQILFTGFIADLINNIFQKSGVKEIQSSLKYSNEK
ncbi:dolichol-phosphate mannosyltransferase [Candidatus Levyibacteriota bacterium]|nr:glycosyltransferase [Candidatus Levybacteria bacterium]GDX61851.1 dolichol-phosphate mannosyltransferase [Candidatus Levybacteria bacterium]